MTDNRPVNGKWLTYSEAAQILGISSEALRSLARRQQWDRRSPNAVGGQAWVLVPVDRLLAAYRDSLDRRPALDETQPRPTERPALTESREPEERWPDRDNDRRSEALLTAVREIAETLIEPVRQQLGDLKTQLVAERERADRADNRADAAEGRVRDLQRTLDEQTVKHRRVVEALVERIPVRRSWWPWQR